MNHYKKPGLSKSMTLFMLILASLFLLSCSFGIDPQQITSSRFALVYGVADYPGSGNDLSSTDDDAIAMQALLLHFGYETQLRLDADVTRQRIFDDIADLSQIMTAEDVLILYFAGHGDGPYRASPDSPDLQSPAIPPPPEHIGESSLIPYYTSPLDASDVIYAAELHTAVETIAGSTVIILDICNSGGFVQSTWPDVDIDPQDYGQFPHTSALLESWAQYFSPDPDVQNSRTWVLSSSGAHELAYEDRDTISHGYFTYYLLGAVGYDEQGSSFLPTPPADLNHDGFVTISELYAKTRTLFSEGYLDDPQTFESAKYLPHLTGGPLDIALFW